MAAGSMPWSPLRHPPITPSWRRRRGTRGWLWGAFISLAVNAAIILVLARISGQDHQPPPPAPDAVRHMTQVPPPTAARPQERIKPRAASTPAPRSPQIPLPALDLPPLGGDPGLALPALGVEATMNAPWTTPSFQTAALNAPDAPSSANAAFDEAPSLAETFDLERFYPRGARLHHIEGQSTVVLSIDEHGAVTSCSVVRSSPVGVFEQAVVQLARSLRYNPAKRAGAPAATTMNLVISWTLK
jgi:protein TonB